MRFRTHLKRFSQNRVARRLMFASILGSLTVGIGQSVTRAQDSTWDNGSSNFAWDLTSTNWSGSNWANGNGAIFGAAGVGAINMNGPISVDSLVFNSDGYTINGAGPMRFMAGISTQSTGVINVASGNTATINAPIIVNNGLGLQKIGAGLLELGGPVSFTGSQFPLAGGQLPVHLMIGPMPTGINPTGGTVRLLNGNVLAASTNVAIGPGYLDIGNNNVTLANVVFTNQNPSAPWNGSLNANNGIVGSGILRVTGEIHTIGAGSNNNGNTIATNLDLGGGAQIIRVGVNNVFTLNKGVMFTGTLSNGSLVKTIGYNTSGALGSVDGISLFGNNIYTGETVLNSGTSIATGTNLTSSVTIAGLAPPGGSQFVLQGANGSLQAATSVNALGGGTFVIDNNVAITGNNSPSVPNGQNNNRLNNAASVNLRDGGFVYRTRSSIESGVTGSESFGSLNVTGGHNFVTIAPNGTAASSTELIAGDFTLDPRATLTIGTAGAAGTAVLGTNAKLLFTGLAPVSDSTGIVRRVVTGTSTAATATTPGGIDFVTFNSTDGFKAYTGYATDFSGAGTNVNIAAGSTLSGSQNINALKATTGTAFTTNLGGNTLTIGSGMMLSTSANHTISNGTLNFGSNPGTVFGSHTFSSAVTGTDGLIHATGTLTLDGNMSGLSGALTASGTGTTNLNTATFAGDIQLRRGTLSIGTNQTSTGTITLGVPENSSKLFHGTPTLSFTSNQVTQISQNILVDNGGTDLYGVRPSDSLVARLQPVGSSATGPTQTLSGNIELKSDLALFGQGVTATSTSATRFTGNISGDGRFLIRNGRVIFDVGSTWSNSGGLTIGGIGNVVQASFFGTGAGTGDITVTGSTTGVMGLMRYNNDNSFGSGSITVLPGTTGVTFEATASSTINNQINLLNGTSSPTFVNASSGIAAAWAGQMTGSGTVTKNGSGTWVIANATNSHTGAINVNEGALMVTGQIAASSQLLTVGANGTLAGVGVIDRAVVVNGRLSPGTSSGALTLGGLTMNSGSTFSWEATNASATGADLLQVNGSLSLSGVALDLSGADLSAASWVVGDKLTLLSYSGTGITSGFVGFDNLTTYTFGSNQWLFQYNDLSAGSNFASLATGDFFVTFSAVPEPGSFFLLTLPAAIALWRRRRMNSSSTHS